MVETTSPSIPRVSPAEARVAMEKSKRAEEALRKNNFDYGIALLMECCTADPYNLKYRQSLRQAEKNKFKDNAPNAQVVVLKTGLTRFRLWWAVFLENYQKALILAEQILLQNPWDVPTQMKLAKAFEGLELLDHALWVLDQARQKDPKNVRVNRALAQLFEKRGNFPQAIAFWEMVRKAIPTDAVAQRKVSDLAANHAIAKAFGGKGTETTGSAQQKALTGSGTLKALSTS